MSTKSNTRTIQYRAHGVIPLMLTGLLALGACTGAPAPGSGPTAAPNAGSNATEITITATDLKFDPAAVRLQIGQPARVTFVNRGAIEHDWEAAGLQARDVQIVSMPNGLSQRMRDESTTKAGRGIPHLAAGPSQTMVATFIPAQTGAFAIACLVPGHRESGMVGQLTVVDASGVVPAQVNSATTNATTTTGRAPAAQSSGNPPVSGSGLPIYADTTLAQAPPVTVPRLGQPRIVPAPPVQAPRVVPIEIEARELVGQMDDGVGFHYWTFGGTVPGPMLRIRLGDTVELTFKNAADSRVTHSIDLHAATGPGGGARVTQVAPGQEAAFRFQALNPGAYVYHCATPPVAQHVAAGMYGLIVVEPPEGLPRVDREFYVMQGDFYLQGGRGDKGERAFAMEKMLDERPDYVVFNGSVGALAGDGALQARVGETIRIFFGVGGPNVTSSFHVIGEIFDRIAPEAGSTWVSNVQTTMVPAGGATIVEFKLEVPGDYVLVDHSLGRVAKGAAGILHVEGPENPAVFEALRGPGAGGDPMAH